MPPFEATISELAIDSLELADLWFAAETEFGIDLRDADVQSVRTFGDIVKLIEDRRHAS